MQDMLADFPDFDLSAVDSPPSDPFRKPASDPDWARTEWYEEWKRLSTREYHGKIPD